MWLLTVLAALRTQLEDCVGLLNRNLKSGPVACSSPLGGLAMLARSLRGAPRVRGGPHALLRHMTGLPNFPPPRGKHEDPLEPNLVMEEEKTGLAAGLPFLVPAVCACNFCIGQGR